ncbi:alpha/beta hydrolase [Sulfitobacter sp. HNIBRBA2951]|uniref:alpha/beta fold hydrolase n=1 Tax=Sulfitobacter aquimarinus TaxID=3158557 RepID=UPI0032DE2E86
MIWLLLIFAALVAAPFVREHYRPKMSDGRRGSAPGQFAELSQGVTHFHQSGPPDGPLVVCVHGLTTPSFVWEPLAKGLNALGFRVLVYDLLGRGFSDRPEGVQDKAFFNTQLRDLLEHLEIDAPFHLIGYSMGGAVATGFAATYPVRVRRLVMIASAGMQIATTPMVRFIRDRGVAGQWLMLAAYPFILRRGIEAERAAPNAYHAICDGQKAQLEFAGFVPAVLASLRGILRHPMAGEHMTLHRNAVPLLAIWGAEDDVIPASAMGQLAQWNRDAVHEVIEDAGHALTYLQADEVLAHIAGFLPAPEGDDWGHDT